MKIADLYAALSLKIDKASFRAADVALDKAKKKVDKSLGQKTIGTLGKGALGVGASFLKTGILGIGAAAGFAAKDALDFDSALTRLHVSSSGAMGTVDQMKDALLKVSTETGLSKEETIAAAQAYVALTGDGKGAAEAVGTFAKVARASASPAQDIAGAAAAMSQQFGVLPSQMEEAFAVLISGGKAGKIELADMASLTAELGASFKQFSGSKGLEGVANLGAMFQVAVRDFGSAAQASTGLQRLMAQIQTREFDLRKAGINIRKGGKGADRKDLKDLMTLVQELAKAQAKNPEGFLKAFGHSQEAMQTLRALRDGAADVKKLAVETRNATNVTRDFNEVQNSSSGRVQAAWTNIKNQIVAAFTPDRMEQFVAGVELALVAATKVLDVILALVDEIERLGGGKTEDLGTAAVRKAAETAYRQRNPNASQKDINKAGEAAVAKVGGGSVNRGGAKAYDEKTILERLNPLDMWENTFKRNFLIPDATIQAANRLQKTGTTAMTLNLTVNANGVDPAGVKDAVVAHTDTLLRTAAAAVGTQ